MKETNMSIRLATPLTDEAIKYLNIGDQLMLSGYIYTARDAAHKRLVDLIKKKESLPFDPNGSVIFYVGPSPAKPGYVIGAAVGDGKGNIIGSVMMKKMALTDKGKAWAGVTVLDKKLYEASRQLIKALNWRGPLEVEVLKDSKGNYNLLEINPRFPAWIYLSHGVDRNLPLALIKLAMDEKPQEYNELKPGIMFIRYAEEVIVPISRFESLIVNGVSD